MAHGCVPQDFENHDTQEILQIALDSCEIVPSFIVIDDVDSLTPEDQQRALELGMRIPKKTKMLLTTRVNFSYSPDNVLKLDGLGAAEFKEYVTSLRERYGLPTVKDSKVERLREVTAGSPLFTDSLLRLEKRGSTLDQAITQWIGQRGLEARKAALQREIQQLDREAKRALYVISLVNSASYAELSRILGYTDQTLGDALQELAGLFLVSAPSIGDQARYTVEPNTGRLVLELVQSLGIDHTALVSALKRARTDPLGLRIPRRSGVVGLAIAQAITLSEQGESRAALEALHSASRQLKKPNADLLLAIGRFSLKQSPPNLDKANRSFADSYQLGQRKQILFDLWFETECARGVFESAIEITKKAIEHEVGDIHRWYEKSAQAHVAIARKSVSTISVDSAIREVDEAISDLNKGRRLCKGEIQRRLIDQLLEQAIRLKTQLIKKITINQ